VAVKIMVTTPDVIEGVYVVEAEFVLKNEPEGDDHDTPVAEPPITPFKFIAPEPPHVV
jgi:hypothetical protein